MTTRILTRIVSTSMMIMVLAMSLTSVVQAYSPGNSAFNGTWSRTDQPVLDGVTARTWMWGPEATTQIVSETYAESPNGTRQVQYFDKARMEITNPGGDSGSIWYVTNGLLVVELITGQMQVGDNSFETRNPADVNVAGDFDDPTGPTYATFGSLLDASPRAIGATISERVDRQGIVTNDPALAGQSVEVSYIDNVTNHAIAEPFWNFMNSSGTVYQNGQYLNQQLFQDPFFATGRPITEAYWAEVKVGGEYKDVLMQCFERRCLTYTPGNPQGFIVEAGNVGGHYYEWRYGDTGTDNGNDDGNGNGNDNGGDEPPVETATTYRFLDKMGLPSLGQFIDKPNDVAAAPNGDVYITDTVDRQILRFDRKGQFVTVWGSEGTGNGQFQNPRGIAVDEEGFVYVADKKQNRIQKFDPNGAFVLAFGTTGSGDGQFSGPHGVAAGGGYIYVADQGNSRVQKFDTNGVYLTKWGTKGAGNGQLDAPHGIDVSPSGLIYVADSGNDRVQIFDGNGAWQGGFGSTGTGDGQFDHPMGITVGGTGEVFVSDPGTESIQQFSVVPVVAPSQSALQAVKYQFSRSVDGEFIDPTGVDLDPNGRLVVADRGNDRIQIFASNNVTIFGGPMKLVDTWKDDTRGRFSFGNPDGVAVGLDGRIYAVDNNDEVVKVFSPEGEFLTQYGPSVSSAVTLRDPLDLAVDSEGNLYVSDPVLDAIIKLSPDGGFIAQFGTPGDGAGQFSAPAGIALDANDNIYVADTGNKRVHKFAPNFSLIDAWTGTAAELFDAPVGIAIHGERVYVTDSGAADKVRVFDLDGASIGEWAGFDQPAGIATDAHGYVYVGDKAAPIQKFSPEGELIARIARLGSGDGEIALDTAGPRVALDPAGNVYVGDPGNNRIQVFEPVN